MALSRTEGMRRHPLLATPLALLSCLLPLAARGQVLNGFDLSGASVPARDARLPLKEWVLGLRLDGDVKAYPFSGLERLADARGRLAYTVAGRRIEIRYDRLHCTAEVFDSDGRSLPAVMAYWFAWVAFHPKTGLRKEP